MVTAVLTKRDDRQDVLSAEYVLDWNEATGIEAAGTHTLTGAFTLPANARVVGGEIVVDTAWDATTTTLDVGDGADPDRYTAAPVNLQVAARTALTLTGFKYTETDQVDFELVVTGTATTGQALVRIEYIVEGRAHEVQE
jgi:hypothetical protein